MTKIGAPTQERPRIPEQPKPKRRFKPWFLIPLGFGAVLIWYINDPKLFSFLPFHLGDQVVTGQIRASGRIEGYETDIGAKTAGRVDYVAVREGDKVHKGQVIVRLSDEDVQAQLRGATAQIASARQQENQYRIGISVIQSQIAQEQLNLEQSKGDAKGRIFQAEGNVAQNQAQLAQAQAQVKQAQADLDLARLNRDRYATLARQGAESQSQADQYEATYQDDLATLNARKAAVDAARKQVSASIGALVQARSTGLNPDIEKAKIGTLYQQLAQSQAQAKGAEDEVANAVAAREQIAAQIAYLNVVSPIDGVVTARSVEPGAVVTSGKTLLTVINPNTVYLRAYVPEGEIGAIRIGQRADVFLDSAPNRPFAARVSAIDTQASFTPENIYFQDQRVKQVFGIKISIDNPAGFAKPGMPADAKIFTHSEGS
ncbi:MAG: HlyD family secretion protein [Chroococcidiopsidaceae cyanobacterium CP_BM_ER_R8_30]|nr:HlyD family secretion protein [Chroococcidiopsidaceae cyanobacterium CP_BM_ER_R8_30]